MNDVYRQPGLSLRTKLVLSYLAVALSAILILAVAVTWALQSYFNQAVKNILAEDAGYRAGSIVRIYSRLSEQFDPATIGNPKILTQLLPHSDTDILVYMDTQGQLSCVYPNYLSGDNCDNNQIKSLLNSTIKSGRSIDGSMNVERDDNGTISTLYTTRQVAYADQESGKIYVLGALYLAASPDLFSGGFVSQVNQVIYIAGVVVAVVVIVLSFLLVRRLTRPLEELKLAAERVKEGNYTQRVVPPKSQDELGQLAQTFNEMAQTIESDMSELRRQDQVRRDLIANIAHDLATPLTAIQGFSEALADDVISEPAARHETAQRIGREVQRLRRLVADIQNMSSLEAGRTQLDLAPLDMHALVDETLFVIEPECEQAGITLHNEIVPNPPPVLADSDRIAQVLLNLLDNARRHTPAGGTISVSAAIDGNALSVWVTDTGSGISAEDLPHIFERFYRADRSRTGATGGSGLGLSIVRAIISAHGGTIRAESTPGQGTRIIFTLPLASPSLSPQVNTAATQAQRQEITAGRKNSSA